MGTSIDLTLPSAEIVVRGNGTVPPGADAAADGMGRDLPARSGALTEISETDPDLTFFHMPWWLEAMSDGGWNCVTAGDGRTCHLWLPYAETRRHGARLLGMPPLTHTLGPVIRTLPGRTGSAAAARRRMIDEALGRLPPFEGFFQALSPDAHTPIDFELNGWEVGARYTYRLDTADGLDAIWSRFSQKARAKIRHAERAVLLDEPMTLPAFVRFYERNLRLRGIASHHGREVHDRLVTALRNRADQHRILTAYDRATLRPAAAVLLVWDRRALYYFRATRDPEHEVNGIPSLLVWEAVKLAARLGRVFDSDAFLGAGGARFMESFDATPVMRPTIARKTLRLKASEALERRVRAAWFSRIPGWLAGTAAADDPAGVAASR